MSTPEIQVAFQGGGAKLAAMLPVAHAFRTAHESGLINIKAVSGTSAGSICAALVAANADFDKVRDKIVSTGDEVFRNLLPAKMQKLAGKFKDGKIPPFWQLVGDGDIILDLLARGKPAFNAEQLKHFLATILETGTGKKNLQVDKLSCTLYITTSNVVGSEGIVHDKGDLIEALIDSCSLPVILRSFSDLAHNHNVDGGICDNLPVEPLLQNEEAPVFAVFPSKDPKQPPITNILSYLLALFTASINHNVVRSKKHVSEAFHFEVDTDLSMLEFDRAVKLLSNDADYKIRFDKAYRKIENFSKSAGVLHSTNQFRVVNQVSREKYERVLMQITKEMASDTEIVKFSLTIKIHANRKITGNYPERPSDEVKRTTTIKAKKAGLRFYRGLMPSLGKDVVPTVWAASNITTKKPLKISATPLGDLEHDGDARKHCLIQFIEPTEIEEGDEIEIIGVYHPFNGPDMRLLNEGKSDFMGFTNPQETPVKRGELILIYPRTLGTMTFVMDETHGTVPNSKIKTKKFTNEEKKFLDADEDILGAYVTNLAHNAAFFITLIPT